MLNWKAGKREGGKETKERIRVMLKWKDGKMEDI